MAKSEKGLQLELEILREILRKFPDGASLNDILSDSNRLWNERTLQRRLLKMEKELQEIRVTGGSKTTRYHLLGPAEAPAQTDFSGIPLSVEGLSILNYVTKPLHQRKPVSYHRSFLEQYRPNRTHYLSPSDLARLEKVSQTRVSQEPAGTYARSILNRLLIDLSWNSSRLEGNTYSLLDTRELIAFGNTAKGKSTWEAQMILNHKEAIEFLVETAGETGFNRYTIMNLHGLLSNNLLADPAAVGRLRNMEVGISNSVYNPIGIPALVSELFDQVLEKARAIESPFEQAFFVTVHLPYLQPFDDVNKRVSRLAANLPFFQHNLSPLSFVDVPGDLYLHGIMGVYELHKMELFKDVFCWAYERSADRYAAIQQSLGEPDPFRLKYREEMKGLIFKIVSNAMDASSAQREIEQQAHQLAYQDQAKFIEATETELLSLHEGNMARYKIRPSEFEQWSTVWSRGR